MIKEHWDSQQGRDRATSGCNIFFLIGPILFLYYEESLNPNIIKFEFQTTLKFLLYVPVHMPVRQLGSTYLCTAKLSLCTVRIIGTLEYLGFIVLILLKTVPSNISCKKQATYFW